MTSHKDIQSLIDDIDGILPKAGSRLPWSKPSDVTRERRVLERVRSYLVSQQQTFATSSERSLVAITPAQAEVAQQIVQAVTQEMDVLRADLMQPLQADLEALRQQRESLVQEIRQLERARWEIDSQSQQKNAQQQFISEFSQELISRCTASLTQQLAQLLGDLDARLVSSEAIDQTMGSASSDRTQVGTAMLPSDCIEQRQQLQGQSDRLLSTLEANQRVIFETLQRNLQSYQESLSQGLEKMHDLGMQGEMLFTALVNGLAQQLGRDASTILRSSVQVSDATGQTSSDTLLPSEVMRGSEQNSLLAALTPQANSLLGTPIPLQPDQLPSEQESQSLTANTQEAIENAANPLQRLSESLAEDNVPKNLSAEDWEIIEGLDSENLGIELDDSDRIDTFLQQDIDPPSSLSSDEDIETPNQSDTQELEALLRLLNERSTTPPPSAPQIGAGEVLGSDPLNQAADLNAISDRRRQEIDDLYKSLFGTDSLIGAVKPMDELESSSQADSNALEPKQSPSSHIPADEQSSNTEAVIPLSSEVEELLFEGLVDPATEAAAQGQAGDWSQGQLAGSWQALFFEDAATRSPVEAGSVGEAGLLPISTDSVSSPDQESIKTITALTDLFEEMGLHYNAPAAKADLMPATPIQQSEDPTPEPDRQISLVEENYIPALPEEDLLVTDELPSDPEREIWLDQNTLQQLSEDLYSFEDGESRNFRRQDQQMPLGNLFELPAIGPDRTPANEQYPQFLMSDELLAEDWEEFAFNNLSTEEATSPSLADFARTDLSLSAQEPNQGDAAEEDVAKTEPENGRARNPRMAASEAVELDFDPDLFPSETLELDQESVSGTGAIAADGRVIPEELIAIEEEIVIEEMEWDEPTDSTTEEAIASSGLDFHEEAVSEQPSMQQSSTETPVQATTSEDHSTGDGEAFREEVQNQLLDSTQDTTLPPPVLLEAALNPEPQDGETVRSETPLQPAISEEDREAFSEEVQNQSLDSTEATTLPAPALAEPSDALPVDALDFEQQDAVNVEHSEQENNAVPSDELAKPQKLIAPASETLRENKCSDSLVEEAQRLERSNFDVDLPQPDALNSEQPDNEKKKPSNSDVNQ